MRESSEGYCECSGGISCSEGCDSACYGGLESDD